MTAPPLFIGLDAGGTKTDVVAISGDDRRTLGGPRAQALYDGPDAAADTLAALVADARSALPDRPLGGVCAGVAGAGRDPERSAIEARLREVTDGAPVRVVHDAVIALEAAFPGESGAVLIVGTGSVLVAHDAEGALHRVGGWGWRLGDDGSGTALGRAALRAALAHHDGGPPTLLAEHLAEHEGLDSGESLLRAVYTDGRSVALFAPSLLAAAEAGDWVAEQALYREANAAGQQAGWLATRLGDRVEPRLALCGGLAGEPAYRSALDAALARHLPGWTLVETPVDPVEGALYLARRLADG